ncbi:uncharacterized protein B0H64DRAFT_99618 [Chaetomium fimeti]|uniref:Uncharacterized protein n=1 Tax=Chaetomium fimeti TaxID=1854472 RepID=A0AAE0HMP5_9PEZI|nr:hypothetical protein B0H64DRAFT_99618 [Chaetomium fimeti]
MMESAVRNSCCFQNPAINNSPQSLQKPCAVLNSFSRRDTDACGNLFLLSVAGFPRSSRGSWDDPVQLRYRQLSDRNPAWHFYVVSHPVCSLATPSCSFKSSLSAFACLFRLDRGTVPPLAPSAIAPVEWPGLASMDGVWASAALGNPCPCGPAHPRHLSPPQFPIPSRCTSHPLKGRLHTGAYFALGGYQENVGVDVPQSTPGLAQGKGRGGCCWAGHGAAPHKRLPRWSVRNTPILIKTCPSARKPCLNPGVEPS